METKYPNCVVQLSGTDGNAVSVFRTVHRELRKYLVDEEGFSPEDAQAEADAFQEEATSGDYDNVLITCHRWVTAI